MAILLSVNKLLQHSGPYFSLRIASGLSLLFDNWIDKQWYSGDCLQLVEKITKAKQIMADNKIKA